MFTQQLRFLNVYSGVTPFSINSYTDSISGMAYLDDDPVFAEHELHLMTTSEMTEEYNKPLAMSAGEASNNVSDILVVVVHNMCLNMLTAELKRQNIPWTYRGIFANACDSGQHVLDLDVDIPGLKRSDCDMVKKKLLNDEEYNVSDLWYISSPKYAPSPVYLKPHENPRDVFKAVDPQEKSQLMTLPPEILEMILSYLDENALISLGLSCKKLSNMPGFWRRIFIATFKFEDAKGWIDWHQYYRRALRFRLNFLSRARIVGVVRHNIPQFDSWARELGTEAQKFADGFLAHYGKTIEEYTKEVDSSP
ncbi:hypothetical protein FBU59_007203, partial [Linderina macrospora]